MSRLRSFVSVTPGLESVLAAELRNILGKDIVSMTKTPSSPSSSTKLKQGGKSSSSRAAVERVSLASLKKQQQERSAETSASTSTSSSSSSSSSSGKLPVLKIVEGGVEIPPLLIEDIWRVALGTRVGDSVRVRIHNADVRLARSFREFKDQIRLLPWKAYLPYNVPTPLLKVEDEQLRSTQPSVSTVSYGSKLYHERAVSQRVDIVLSQEIGVTTVTPQAHGDNPSRCPRIYVLIQNDRFQVSIGAAELLYKRGYKQLTTESPMRETLAAACLIASRLNQQLNVNVETLWDPFAGSGTLILEAVAMAEASNFPPINLLSNPATHSDSTTKTLGFMWWRSFKESQFLSFVKSLVRPLLGPHKPLLEAESSSSDKKHQNSKKKKSSDKVVEDTIDSTTSATTTNNKELDSIFHPERIDPILLPQSPVALLSSSPSSSSSSSSHSSQTPKQETTRTHYVMSDSSSEAIEAAQQNTEALLKYHLGANKPKITIQKRDFEKMEKSITDPSTTTIITNLPYGIRINQDDYISLYNSFGKMLKRRKFKDVFVVCGGSARRELRLQTAPLKWRSIVSFSNGGVPVELLQLEDE